MSSFQCEKCGLLCLELPGRGHVSGCDHYPVPDRPGPTVQELISFTRELCGADSPEYRVAIEMIGVCGPEFTEEEVFLLLFLTEAWKWREIR